MAMWLIILLLPLTWTVDMAAGTEASGTINIVIVKSTDSFSAEWDWDDLCPEDVTFTAVYEKLDIPDSKPQECAATIECSCEIPSDSLDHGYNYTLRVSAAASDGRKLSSSKDFDPNRETKAPPDFRVTTSDALVMVKISNPDMYYTYKLILRENNSTEENPAEFRMGTYIIPPGDLLPEQTYCLKVKEFNTLTLEVTPFSSEECFTAPAKGPPNNLRMEALDAMYILRWDWDFEQFPNVTFSVENCHKYECTKIKACKNLTSTQCDCSTLDFAGEHILRVSAYDSQIGRRSASVMQFEPSEDTIFGPPKDLMVQMVQNELLINVSAPKGFKNADLYRYCHWLTHLKYWTNSTLHSKVMVKENELPFFNIKSLEASTTYCTKAKMKCKSSNRSSLYSEVFCITTDPRPYLVQWIAPVAFLGIVMIAVCLYFCFCPLKRYMDNIFFPSTKLPSSIEKGFGESPLNCINHPFLFHEEESTDHCYTVQNSNAEDLGQFSYNSSSKDSSQDSGNCSNESQAREVAATSPQ